MAVPHIITRQNRERVRAAPVFEWAVLDRKSRSPHFVSFSEKVIGAHPLVERNEQRDPSPGSPKGHLVRVSKQSTRRMDWIKLQDELVRQGFAVKKTKDAFGRQFVEISRNGKRVTGEDARKIIESLEPIKIGKTGARSGSKKK